MMEPRNGFWFLHHVDPIQLGVVAGIMDIVRESFGPPMVGLGEHISLGFLKRNLKLGDLEDMVLGNGVRVRDLAMDLFVTIDPAPSAVMIEANLCFPWDRENGVIGRLRRLTIFLILSFLIKFLRCLMMFGGGMLSCLIGVSCWSGWRRRG